MIAKTVKILGIRPAGSNGNFLKICQDILTSQTSRVGSRTNQGKVKDLVKEMIKKHIG
jgi:hypothetical protein